MAWSSYSMTKLPAAQRQALAAVLSDTDTSLASRFRIDADEIAVDWRGFVHPSAALVAALVEALLDPAMVATVRATERWTDTLTCIYRMDRHERAVLDAMTGRYIPPPRPEERSPERQGIEAAIEKEKQARQAFNGYVRELVALPEVAPYFRVTEPDDGTHDSVRPVGYELDAGRDALAVIARKSEIRKLPQPWQALLAVLLASYGNEDLTTEVFSGPGLALKTGEAAPALLTLPIEPRHAALRMMAGYTGW